MGIWNIGSMPLWLEHSPGADAFTTGRSEQDGYQFWSCDSEQRLESVPDDLGRLRILATVALCTVSFVILTAFVYVIGV